MVGSYMPRNAGTNCRGPSRGASGRCSTWFTFKSLRKKYGKEKYGKKVFKALEILSS
jgi:hypothetical protein